MVKAQIDDDWDQPEVEVEDFARVRGNNFGGAGRNLQIVEVRLEWKRIANAPGKYDNGNPCR